MGKRRGSGQLIVCAGCSRRVKREKAVRYDKRQVYSTDFKTSDDIKLFHTSTAYYCPSCGKSRKIYDKKKKQAMRKYNK
ncbi:MAG: hypothetical protein ABIG39_03975 [Candidatus Micrarchaeota archaeon]